MVTMTIVEGMKRLRLITKQIESQMEDIKKYASKSSFVESYPLGSKEDHENQIKSLIKSNEDLIVEYVRIKSAIEYTNLITKVDLRGKTYTISDLLTYRRKVGILLLRTHQSLDDSEAERTNRAYLNNSASKDTKVATERFFDEKMKLSKLREIQDFLGSIDGRLEVVNATTELMFPNS